MRLPALALLAVACSSSGRGPGDRPLALWSEFLSDDQVRAQLPFLAARRADLYLAVKRARVGDPALAALIGDADRAGVGVRAWLLLDDADGYWANETNVDAVRAAVMAFADWRDAAGLPVRRVIFDMEMSLARTQAVAAAQAANGAIAAVDVIKQGRDPAAFTAARAKYVQLVDDVHARGLEVTAVTYPMVLDDPQDDDDIQDELDVPITGVPWDEVSFMIYQSTIYDLSGEWWGPDVVQSYGQSAASLFPGRASVALGIVGQAGIAPVAMPYPSPDVLNADRAAALGAGARTVSIYSLDGVSTEASPADWAPADVAPSQPPYVDADNLRRLIRALLD
jgi:hypothetical protein